MITAAFFAFLGLAMVVSLTDWRRGWILAVLCGILQDPARKLTSGAPVEMSLSIMLVYVTILFANYERLQKATRDIGRRFGAMSVAFALFLLFLILGAMNGLIRFGIAAWKAPILSLAIYLTPIPAVILGYLYLDDEERLFKFFRFYSIVTSIALIGSVLEYLRFEWSVLGMVMQQGDYIRHLPGIQIRMISGFYRAPDIMAWHAATMTSIAIAMIVRGELGRRTWPWILAAGWGFLNCLLSGRRKAIYYVVAFSAVLLWRYFRRLKPAQIAAVFAAVLVMWGVVHKLAGNEETSVYTKGAMATQAEVTERLGGGVLETLQQYGIMGAGLGTATQGTQYILQSDQLGWQEGGVGKLAVELGLPGLMSVAFFGLIVLRLMMRISAHRDLPETSQLARVTLFALIMANIANFMASAQAYSDPLLVLLTAFFAGCLFATATLDERVPAQAPARELAPVTV